MASSRHQARESEPKDYELKDYDPEKRKLHNSTYRRIGNVTDGVSKSYNNNVCNHRKPKE